MKKYYFNFLLLFLGCSSYYQSYPKWYEKIADNKNQTIGYGKATTPKEATQLAINAIAQKLKCQIDSYITIKRESSSKNGNKEFVHSQIKITARTELNSLKVIKIEQIDDMWFVAVCYDNRTLFLKIINSVNPKNQNFTNPYLTRTELFKLLKEYFGFYPKAYIYTQNGQYYISIENQAFLVTQQEFLELFINSFDLNVDIKLKERIKNNEEFFITTQFKEAGFASLFVVSHTGSVVTLFKNIELIDASFTYPNKEKYNGLIAKIEDNMVQSKDLFVALLCKQKEDFGLFNQVSTELEKESFRFGQLIDLMDRCAFSTRIMTIYR